MKIKTIANLKVGEKATIINLTAEKRLYERLTDFGLTDGCEVEVIRAAPLGDPILIKVRGCQIALRKADSALIEVR